MSAHTPGPWTVEIEEYEENSGTITIPEINRILHDPEWAQEDEWELDVANARLIAAAPELLEACREALEKLTELDTSEGPPTGIIYELIRAITKAGGEWE